jgi:hypothetical protein
MSTHVIAEYPNEDFAVLRDGGGTFFFTRSDSILPIDDERPLSLRPRKNPWEKNVQQSLLQDFEDEFYQKSMQ